ncbi:S-layer homology domain-containing protein [Selenomonas ruminis]|uniref:S-layer protein n=1 Tax=Selenomonas ruminis TaxID=2593411 RepID=A0A5D6VXB3_9FIRM|nr:S-layer homology domain-containing protein [Selenomonas sp. mPRGC5]TYZ19539.1 S-layer protein [Selenomonas sp. mPRGC5]
MKKTLVSALTTALVIGAASTTFAAAQNPFQDVPADHWAYDAVDQLAKDGVVTGYGDGTYKGQKQITRYEMAVMVARAMANNKGVTVSGNDKALLDKLAAEFGDELNNLGVRVTNLEKNADKVKWTGEARYRYWSYRDEGKDKKNIDHVSFRLFPTAEINDNWSVKARLTSNFHMDQDDSDNTKLSYIFAEGNYGSFNVKAGKMPFYSTNDDGLVMDDFFSGVQATVGNKVKLTAEAGRWNINEDANAKVKDGAEADTASYQGVQLNAEQGKLTGGLGYRHFSSEVFKKAKGYKANKDDADILSVGARYTFDKNWAVAGAYAENTDAKDYKKSGSAEIDYKGANKANKGSFGALVAYRHLGSNASLMPTFDTAHALFAPYNTLNEKGWDFSASYVPMKNTLTTLGYFNGKQFANHDKKAETLYARVSFFF